MSFYSKSKTENVVEKFVFVAVTQHQIVIARAKCEIKLITQFDVVMLIRMITKVAIHLVVLTVKRSKSIVKFCRYDIKLKTNPAISDSKRKTSCAILFYS